MAGDMMLLMRGLAKLSQAVVETQSSTLRAGSGESVGFWKMVFTGCLSEARLEPVFNIWECRNTRHWSSCRELPVSCWAGPLCCCAENAGRERLKSACLQVNYKEATDFHVVQKWNWCLCLQEMSGQQQQQQSSSAEAEFDFPQDDDAFSSSEFKEEGDLPEEHAESSNHAGSGKQSLFEGYKDPSKQFSGHTRSYHQDARYGFTFMFFFLPVLPCWPLLFLCAGVSPGFTTATTALWTGICGCGCTASSSSVSWGRTTRTPPPSAGWRPMTSRRPDRARELRRSHTNRR